MHVASNVIEMSAAVRVCASVVSVCELEVSGNKRLQESAGPVAVLNEAMEHPSYIVCDGHTGRAGKTREATATLGRTKRLS